MKKAIIFVSLTLVFCFGAFSQYTPLPALDQNAYEKLIERLHTEAKLQGLPELDILADNMSYDEARRFMANPHIYTERMRKDSAGGKPAMSTRAFGIIAAVLYSSLTGLDNYSSGKAKVGFALGLYAMYALGKVYFLWELLYQQNQFGEKGSGTSSFEESYKINSIMLFTAFLYAINLNAIKILIGTGFSFGYLVSGKNAYDSGTSSGEDDIEFGSDAWNRFYGGLNIVAGIMTRSMIMIYLCYTLPLTKLYSDWDAKMSAFKLALAIPLSRK